MDFPWDYHDRKRGWTYIQKEVRNLFNNDDIDIFYHLCPRLDDCFACAPKRRAPANLFDLGRFCGDLWIDLLDSKKRMD